MSRCWLAMWNRSDRWARSGALAILGQIAGRIRLGAATFGRACKQAVGRLISLVRTAIVRNAKPRKLMTGIMTAMAALPQRPFLRRWMASSNHLIRTPCF